MTKRKTTTKPISAKETKSIQGSKALKDQARNGKSILSIEDDWLENEEGLRNIIDVDPET